MHGARESSHAGRDLALWTGLLGAPTLWLIQLQISYSAILWACRTGQRSVLYVTGVAFVLLSGAVMLLAVTLYMRLPRSEEPSDDAVALRQHFMAGLGMLVSALFTLVIIVQTVARFIISPCQE